MNYEEAIASLSTLTNYERTYQPEAMQQVRLDRMRWACEQLNHPQRAFRSILVAGTNAKGSICAILYAILRAAGLRVGLYTSPHLEDVRERIRVSTDSAEEGADWISPQEFAELIAQIQPVIETSKAGPYGALTYFEAMTATAFLHFAQRQVRIGILEVGLGGRCDATNVVDQRVSVIGPIGFDHTEVLGRELTAIAREKAGIVSKQESRRGGASGTTVISAQQAPEVVSLLEETVGREGHLVVYGRQMEATILRHGVDGLDMTVQGMRGRYDGLHLPLIGRHQAENATLAIAAVEALAGDGVPYEAVRRGIAGVRWPGRLEVIAGEPLVLLDGAHNPQALQALREALDELWPNQPLHVLVGMSSDKSVHAISACLAPRAASMVCTRSRHPRAADPGRLARALAASHRRIEVVEDPVDAYTYLVNRAGPEDVVVIAGSLFLVGELRSVVRKRAQPVEVSS